MCYLAAELATCAMRETDAGYSLKESAIRRYRPKPCDDRRELLGYSLIPWAAGRPGFYVYKRCGDDGERELPPKTNAPAFDLCWLECRGGRLTTQTPVSRAGKTSTAGYLEAAVDRARSPCPASGASRSARISAALLITQVAVFLQRLVYDLFQLRTVNRRFNCTAAAGIRCRIASHIISVTFSSEWQFARRHLIKHRPKGKQISARVQLLRPHLLRRHVGHRAQRRPRTGQVLLVGAPSLCSADAILLDELPCGA